MLALSPRTNQMELREIKCRGNMGKHTWTPQHRLYVQVDMQRSLGHAASLVLVGTCAGLAPGCLSPWCCPAPRPQHEPGCCPGQWGALVSPSEVHTIRRTPPTDWPHYTKQTHTAQQTESGWLGRLMSHVYKLKQIMNVCILCLLSTLCKIWIVNVQKNVHFVPIHW